MSNDRREGRMGEGKIRETESLRKGSEKDGGSSARERKMTSLRLTHSHSC